MNINNISAYFSAASMQRIGAAVCSFAGKAAEFISEKSKTITVGVLFFAGSVAMFYAYRSSATSSDASSMDTRNVQQKSSETERAITRPAQPTPPIEKGSKVVVTSNQLGKRTLTKRLREHSKFEASEIVLTGKRISRGVITALSAQASRLPNLETIILDKTTVNVESAQKILQQAGLGNVTVCYPSE